MHVGVHGVYKGCLGVCVYVCGGTKKTSHHHLPKCSSSTLESKEQIHRWGEQN